MIGREKKTLALKTVDGTSDCISDKETQTVGYKSRRTNSLSDSNCSEKKSPPIPLKRPKGKETPSPPLCLDSVDVRRPSKTLHIDSFASSDSHTDTFNSTVPLSTTNNHNADLPLFYSVKSENDENKQFTFPIQTNTTDNNFCSIDVKQPEKSDFLQPDPETSCSNNPALQVTFASISVENKNKKPSAVTRVSSTPSMYAMTPSKEDNNKTTLTTSICSHPLPGSFVFGKNTSAKNVLLDNSHIFRPKSGSDGKIYNFGDDKGEACRDDMNRVSFSKNLASTPAVGLYKYVKHSSHTPINRTQTVPVTPSKPLLPIMLRSEPRSEESKDVLYPTLRTPHHRGRRGVHGIFSPFSNVSKPPSELFSDGNEKIFRDTTCTENDADDKTEKTTSPPSTPFRFCSFPASLPRVHPRREKKLCDETRHPNKSYSMMNKKSEQNEGLCHNYAIQGIDLFASSKAENCANTNTPQRKKGSDSIMLEKKPFGLSSTPFESFTANALQSRCHGRHRSTDTSHDTSMSSISVGSPLSDARRLLSRGSEEGTLDDNVEEGLWPDPGIAQNDDFDLSSDTDSFSDKAKVSGTKLNFNALSPVETENRTGKFFFFLTFFLQKC